MIDMARVNSATIHALNREEDPCTVDSFEYAFDLAMQLVKLFIEERNVSTLQRQIKNRIALVLGRPNPQQALHGDAGPSFSEKRARCHVCYSNAAGEGYSETKGRLPCLKSLCQSCGKHTCREREFFPLHRRQYH